MGLASKLRALHTMQSLVRGARRGLDKGQLLARVFASSTPEDPSPADQHAKAAESKHQPLVRDFHVYRYAADWGLSQPDDICLSLRCLQVVA